MGMIRTRTWSWLNGLEGTGGGDHFLKVRSGRRLHGEDASATVFVHDEKCPSTSAITVQYWGSFWTDGREGPERVMLMGQNTVGLISHFGYHTRPGNNTWPHSPRTLWAACPGEKHIVQLRVIT